MNSLHCGDCLEVMEGIPAESIDMVLTDLPYGVINRNNANARWDNTIDVDRMWRCFKRITRKDAAIVLFGQGMFTADLMRSNKPMWRYNLIWEKDRPTGFLNANRMPLRSHEDLLVFYRKLPTYHPQMVPCRPEERSHPKGKGVHKDTNNIYGSFNRAFDYQISDMKFPRSVIRINKEHYCKGEHPTQKPVALCEWLIKTYSDPGDTVLDCCMGSGTTGVACMNTGRDFVGIEIQKDYYDLAVSRVNDAIQNGGKGGSSLPGNMNESRTSLDSRGE